MAKRREVDAHFDQRGYAKSGDAYNKAIYEAQKEDDAYSYGSAEQAQTDPALDACCDAWRTKCIGNSSDDPEEGSDSCCIIS